MPITPENLSKEILSSVGDVIKIIDRNISQNRLTCFDGEVLIVNVDISDSNIFKVFQNKLIMSHVEKTYLASAWTTFESKINDSQRDGSFVTITMSTKKD